MLGMGVLDLPSAHVWGSAELGGKDEGQAAAGDSINTMYRECGPGHG